MQREELKKKLCETVDRRREQIISIGEQIMNNPELGFKEFNTAKLVAKTLGQLGIPYQEGLADRKNKRRSHVAWQGIELRVGRSGG